MIELNSTIGILLPSYSREIRRGGLTTCQSNPPPDGAVVYDGIHGEGVWIAAAFILGPQALRF
jgi:hypothetical protein